jgi:ribose 5-phosphate isomerase B
VFFGVNSTLENTTNFRESILSTQVVRRQLIAESDVIVAARAGKREIVIEPRALITPLARDTAKILGVRFVDASSSQATAVQSAMVDVVIGSDHSGVAAKAELKKFLAEKQYRVIDVGTMSEQSCDYPDFALLVGDAVRSGRATFGLMLDGVGTASAVVLNKLPSIRAACCYNEFSARIARAHGDANVLTLGAKTLGIESLKSIVAAFLDTPFEGGRHLARLQKIADLEQRFSRYQ